MSNNIWITADIHRGHKNIIKFTRRGEFFDSIEEHDEAILENINKCVKPGDRLYIIGDVSFGNKNDAVNWINRINTHMRFLVKGNHDQENKIKAYLENECFVWVKDVCTIKAEEHRFFASHYSHRVWPYEHHGTFHVYGHSHNSLPDDPCSRSMDVGLDSAIEVLGEYRPFHADELVEILMRKDWAPKDHHTQRE